MPKLLARAAVADVRAGFWFLLQDAASGLGSDVPFFCAQDGGAAPPD